MDPQVIVVSGRARDLRRYIASVSGLYLAVAGVATWWAVEHGLAGEPLGIDLGVPPMSGFLLIGTALSAPLTLLVLLIWACLRLLGKHAGKSSALLVGLACCFLVGMLAEPVTWQPVGLEAADLFVRVIVIMNLVLPSLMLGLSIGIRRCLTLSGDADRGPLARARS